MKTFPFGTLEADTATWLLVSEHVIPLDMNSIKSFDNSLEHNKVSVVGTTGIPPSSLEIKLIVESSPVTQTSHAYDIFSTGTQGSSVDHWCRAERELLDL